MKKPIVIVLLIVSEFLFSSCQKKFEDVKPADSMMTPAPAPLPAPSVTAKNGWNYRSTTDDMRGTTTTYAEIRSNNELHFASPYDGGSYGTITIRHEGSHTYVVLRISTGQILTRYDGISVPIKFDNLPVKNFRGLESEDGNSNVIFIEPETGFINSLRKASKLVVEIPFYREGSRQLEFNVAGYMK